MTVPKRSGWFRDFLGRQHADFRLYMRLYSSDVTEKAGRFQAQTQVS